MFFGIPSRGIVFTETLNALQDESTQADRIYITTISPVSSARNEIVQQFLKTNERYLFMLDDDEVMPFGVVTKMINLLSEDELAVVIDCPSKKTGRSNVFRNKNGSIAATGFGCALFTRKVFETIPEPWFDLSPRRRVEKRNGNWYFPVIDDAPPNPYGGEDINFSLKLKEYGFNIVSVPDTVCTHLSYEGFNRDNRATEILTIERYHEISAPPL